MKQVMRKKRVLIVFPTLWDARQLECCRDAWGEAFEPALASPREAECRWDFDVLAYLDATVATQRGRIDGVMTSSDDPGAPAAAAIAMRLGLVGPPPEAVIRAAHKYYSRLAQRAAAPEATPAFDLIDPARPAAMEFPRYMKPVKGAFSVMSRRVDSAREMLEFVRSPAARQFLDYYTHTFNQVMPAFTDLRVNASMFLAEELLCGDQVTVEGFARGSDVQIVGISDSLVDPTRGSFVRFEYPSRLAAPIQERMADIAGRVVRQLGLVDTFFNIEMFHDAASGRISLIEVNPRMCGQFGDLYQKVDGRSTYEIALRLATGERPAWTRGGGEHRVAASCPLRVYEPVRVARAPSDEDVREAERLFEGTQVWVECATGDVLEDFASLEDGRSIRYAVVNLGAPDRESLERRLAAVVHRLGFEWQPL